MPLTTWIAKPLQYLSERPMQRMASRELLGDVGPHIAIVRTRAELVDSATIQLSNTLFPVGSGYALDVLYNRLQRLIQPIKTPVQRQWYHLGKSLSIFAFIAPIPVANAFLRSYVTAKHTGSLDFIDMVGEKSTRPPQTEAEKEHFRQTTNGYLRTIGRIVGAGALASATLFGLTQLLIRKSPAFGRLPALLMKYIGLEGGRFENFPLKKLAPVLFWGIPIYTGLFAASRDKFEYKELCVRVCGFLGSFFLMPWLAGAAARKWAPRAMERLFKSRENFAVLAEFIATSALCAIVPTLVNFVLTHRRVQAANGHGTAFPNPAMPSRRYVPPYLRQPVSVVG